MQGKRWSAEKVAQRRQSSKKVATASLAIFFISLLAMYLATCTKIISDDYLVNNAGPISESLNYFSALLVCILPAVSGAGILFAARLDKGFISTIKPLKAFLLFLSSIIMAIIAVLVGWNIYGDPVFCKGCETGSCEGLVFFRTLNFWAAGFLFASSFTFIRAPFKGN